jgi:hypothetical protein
MLPAIAAGVAGADHGKPKPEKELGRKRVKAYRVVGSR